jgi:hypothetical protein
MAAPDRMGQPSNPRPTSPHHRSSAMNVSRDQTDGRGASRGPKLGSKHSKTSREGLSPTLRLRRQTAGIEQVHRCSQMQICSVMKRSIRHSHCHGQSSRNCTQPLQYLKARSYQASDRPANRDRTLRDIYEHCDSYCYAQQRGRSPSGKYKRLLQELPGANPWVLHWNYKTGLTLAGVLHLPTLASEVRSIGTAAWRTHEQLLRGTIADDELER